MIRATLLCAALSVGLSGGGYMLGRVQGYQKGEAAAQALAQEAQRALQLRLFHAADDMARQAAALQEARRAAGLRQQEFEDAARNDPDAARPGIGADGLRRLDELWRAR